MICRFAIAALLLFADVADAQLISVPPRRVVAKLGACSEGSPKIVAVTDAQSSTDCALGGGAFETFCFCSNGDWSAGGEGPQGEQGEPGAPGAAATISVGSTTTGAAGSGASVVNAGTSGAAVLNFTIPRGDTGAAGATGAQGPAGPAGSVGVASALAPLALTGTVLSLLGTVHTSLSADEHAQYGLLAGRSGGQTIAGGTAALEILHLRGTSHATAGAVQVDNGMLIAPPGSGASALGLRIGTNSGFWEVGSGDLLLAAGGHNVAEFNYSGTISSFFQLVRGGGDSYWLQPISGSMGAPTLGARADDLDTGLGGDGANTLSLVAGGVSSAEVNAAGLRATGKLVTAAQALSIPDNGVGSSRATGALTPSSSYVACTCLDADGCNVPISETGAVDGQTLRIVNVGTNVCALADSAGVTETTGAIDLGPNDSISFIYAVDRWVQLSASNN